MGGRLIADFHGLSVTGLTEALSVVPRSFATMRRLVAAVEEAWTSRIPGSRVIAENVYAPEDYPRITQAPEKIQAFEENGIAVAKRPIDVVGLLKARM